MTQPQNSPRAKEVWPNSEAVGGRECGLATTRQAGPGVWEFGNGEGGYISVHHSPDAKFPHGPDAMAPLAAFGP